MGFPGTPGTDWKAAAMVADEESLLRGELGDPGHLAGANARLAARAQKGRKHRARPADAGFPLAGPAGTTLIDAAIGLRRTASHAGTSAPVADEWPGSG